MSGESTTPVSATRTAVVIANATLAQVQSLGLDHKIALRENKLGVLVTGRPGDLVIDYAAEMPGPVYDIMYNAQTGWFSVTIFAGGLDKTTRWDNRPGTNPGYPRVANVLGASTPSAILAVLDVPPDAVGYAPLALG